MSDSSIYEFCYGRDRRLELFEIAYNHEEIETVSGRPSGSASRRTALVALCTYILV